ncbi:hypothetical protein DH2020_033511 [Rehmannia glutinosa]|uniref:3-deoxy-manno-octulosonate cytidylyltransferase n=1 Tax=Rehmannia glutinosa TaxID=99300 RepID=A0ABR0VEE7_REHGL
MPISNPSSMPSSSTSSSTKSWIIHGVAAGVAAAVAFGVPAYLLSRRPGKFRSRRTWERAKMATSLDHVVVATDDDKIAECCKEFGADVVMTSESCRNGDEPLIEPEIIDGVVKALQIDSPIPIWLVLKMYFYCDFKILSSPSIVAECILSNELCNVKLWEQVPFGYLPGPMQNDQAAPDAVFSTAATSLKPEDAFDPNRVKCVVDNHGYAIYFSRGLIPFNKTGKSYDSKFLKVYPKLPPTPLQLEEDLEQLKVLENGYKMKVIKVDHECHGVDVPDDVEKIEHYMRERNLC